MSAPAARARLKDDRFDEHFLKKLEYLYIVSKKIFAGRMRAAVDQRCRRREAALEQQVGLAAQDAGPPVSELPQPRVVPAGAGKLHPAR